MRLDPRFEKSFFVDYDKQSPAYLIYFSETTIKRVRCVKFTDSYNSSISKPDKNTEFPEYLIIYDIQPKDNLNTEGEGQISCYYCCTLCTIRTNYTEAINSVDLNNWILAMKREFYSLENNSFVWQKAPRNKNVVGSRCFFTIKSKSDGSSICNQRLLANIWQGL